jgi:NAD(P)-dependent dehydrogenase (short-subunit alcohol dehydrogenase family)
MEGPLSTRLAGRTALVTGASRGIGRAIAERLAREGARLVVSARSAGALEELTRSLPGDGHRVLPLDVGDRDALAAALADIGAIDVLVPNAGVAVSAPYHRTDDETWDEAFSVNVTSVFRLCRALVPAMVAARWGRVVIVASNAGLTGYAYTTAYCASKHAVIGMMRAVALEIAESGVTINAVCPGWVDTDMATRAIARIAKKTGKSSSEARAALEAMSPQKRMVQAEEVASLVAFLCSSEARGVHGQALAIDGGQVMR